MLKVAFIDDGIMEGIEDMPSDVKKYIATNDGVRLWDNQDEAYYLSHGTMCWWIFRNYVKSDDFCLYDIRVLNPQTQKADYQVLLKALEFCLKEGITLINMSLGTTCFTENETNDVLRKLYENGAVMIAAKSNENRMTLPSCSPYVIGVIRDHGDLLKKDEYAVLDQDIGNINIVSHCKFEEIEKKYGIVLSKANSFSAPYISAIVCNAMLSGVPHEKIWGNLKKRANIYEKINAFNYIKKGFPMWSDEIDVPIIGCHEPKVLCGLVEEFRNRGYNCVGILQEQTIFISAHMFGYEPYKSQIKCGCREMVQIIVNTTCPDILFTQICQTDQETLCDLLLDKKSEVRSNSQLKYDETQNVEEIADNIENLFG